MIVAANPRGSLRAHWFIPAAIAVAIADTALVVLDGWSNPALVEAGLLFDLAVVVPALYLWCYRARGMAAVVRAIALACLGVWVAGVVVPDEHHDLLHIVGVARYVGLAVLLVIELKLVLVICRSVFRKDVDAGPAAMAAALDAGMPAWTARLMAWEAALWRRAWIAVRRFFGGR